MKPLSIITIIIFFLLPIITIVMYGLQAMIPFFIGALWTAIQTILYKFAKSKGELE